MPSFFIAHGSPSLALEENAYTQDLNALTERYDKPEAVVLFTAHWESPVTTISWRDSAYDTIHDFGGFQPELYAMRYPAKGSTAVAAEVERLLQQDGLESRRNEDRGLDHGAWVVLHHLWPDADVPVVQLSVNPFLPPERQYAIGRALAPLKERGVWIIGSGGTVHNLRMISWGAERAEEWAVAFDDWLLARTMAWDTDALFDYRSLAPHAVQAVPSAEHFVPYVLAMGSGDQKPELLHRSYGYGTLSHLLVRF
ncbi:dioxygenase [Xylanibacillus composti]|uniref:Dioxygenase n=1 Tax=Xylanibacillus composti TaxID=1572762 RepID=A0A8J4H790_9BACL|nr:class III extradiol ring-cleavage dioxygenase [Xylanibacillus composti]MDT9724000.1 dioxygenase [Xylanibacillus composti]GIQ71095.1 dioxygenase [Xylanibacillus composti]